jgi:hypothetical protein
LTALGLGLAWGGYLIFTYGYVLIRGYSGLSLSDLVLPTHRTTALAAIAAGPASQAGASTSSSATAPGTPPPLSQLPAQGGTYKQPGTGIPIHVGPKGSG